MFGDPCLVVQQAVLFFHNFIMLGLHLCVQFNYKVSFLGGGIPILQSSNGII